MTSLDIIDLAMRCGARSAEIEKLALTKGKYGVAIWFYNEDDAIEFVYHKRDEMFGYNITREEHFVLVWL